MRLALTLVAKLPWHTYVPDTMSLHEADTVPRDAAEESSPKS